MNEQEMKDIEYLQQIYKNLYIDAFIATNLCKALQNVDNAKDISKIQEEEVICLSYYSYILHDKNFALKNDEKIEK